MKKIDSTDLKILKILQEDSNIKNYQLAEKIELSEGPTLQRVRKLEERNIIEGYHAIVNPKSLGLGITAYTLVRLQYQIQEFAKNFTDKIRKINEIVECSQLSGANDYLLKIITKDVKELDDIISNNISKIEGIANIQTMIVLKRVKHTLVLPYDYETPIGG